VLILLSRPRGATIAVLARNLCAISMACSKIPYETEQGIFFAEQGIFWREQGIFGKRSPDTTKLSCAEKGQKSKNSREENPSRRATPTRCSARRSLRPMRSPSWGRPVCGRNGVPNLRQNRSREPKSAKIPCRFPGGAPRRGSPWFDAGAARHQRRERATGIGPWRSGTAHVEGRGTSPASTLALRGGARTSGPESGRGPLGTVPASRAPRPYSRSADRSPGS
jgi:hypothetical protein